MPFDFTSAPEMLPLTKQAETEAQKILRGAREVLKNGERWTTGELIDAKGAMCLMGAIMRAGGMRATTIRKRQLGEVDNYEECPAVTLVGPYLVAAVKEQPDNASINYTPDLMSWNDSGTAGETLAALDRAYQLAAEKV